MARKDFPPKNLKEFVAYVKANAEKLNMAHSGVGSNAFNFGLALNSALGVKPTMVPFNGGGPAANALVGGQVDYGLHPIAEVGSQVQAGVVKAYAICAAERSPAVPGVPPPKRLVSQNSRHRLGMPCSRRRAHCDRFETSSPMPSTGHWTTRTCATACSMSAATFRAR